MGRVAQGVLLDLQSARGQLQRNRAQRRQRRREILALPIERGIALLGIHGIGRRGESRLRQPGGAYRRRVGVAGLEGFRVRAEVRARARRLGDRDADGVRGLFRVQR
ncbi:hypothetical protein FQZ97_816890 [compost metagenome]